MPDRANVSNIEALERFRSSLVLFVEKANAVLDEVSDEVKRTRVWLQSEQRMNLTHQIKRCNRDLETLQQELFTARLSRLQNMKTGQQMQINKKRREIRDLEDKLRAVSAWLRNYDSTVETEARKVEKLRHLLDTDTVRALTFLAESVRSLEAYTQGE